MDNSVLIYTAVFCGYSLLEITGALPQEVRSAGLSLPAIFQRYYGYEEVDFVLHHIKRTTTTMLVHSSLPLAYTLGLQLVYPHFNIVFFWQASSTIIRLMIISILTFLTGLVISLVFTMSDRKFHPFVRLLSKYGQNWKVIASVINSEFRHIDKFISVSGSRKLVVTDSWVILCGLYTMDAVRQDDVTFHVKQSEEVRVESEEGRTQFLTIRVASTGQHATSFDFRLRADEYGRLRNKLSSPIQVARQIVIQQSLSDRFLQAFEEQVLTNGTYRVPSQHMPLEPCFGCSQKMPEVKLKKMCAPPQEGECRSCDCKPMWCLECMSKWFASRQDQYHPNTWMGSHASCPLCRKTFCMLDVLRVEQ